MVSLYNRANARQWRVLRIIEGAVKNVYDHHKDFKYSPRLARSIAKRAAGTLTAAWPDVLAAKPSDMSDPENHASGGHQTPHARQGSGGGQDTHWSSVSRQRGGSQVRSAHPFYRKIVRALSLRVAFLKRSGDTQMAEGVIEALRIIDRIISGG